MTEDLSVQFARRFVQRRDVKAVQFNNGAYIPDRELKNRHTQQPDPGRYGPLGWQMQHLQQHLAGTHTYGHYLLDQENNCRLFALDIDLEKGNKENPTPGYWIPNVEWHEGMDEATWEVSAQPVACDPRATWADRSATGARMWFKSQMSILARRFCRIIQEELGLPCAAAYSGSKGVHVYGFTGPRQAAEVREMALYILDFTDEWDLHRGQSIFKHRNQDPFLGYQNFSIEVFPKQASLEGKDLGNLMRLPLGRNLKSQDPTFFLDFNTPIATLAPHPNPVQLLTEGNPFA